MTLENQTSRITLHGLELDAFLGWPDAERAERQRILIDIHIQFQTPPTACLTDNLENTYCYDALVVAVRHLTAAKSFRLIEHVGYEIYQTIKTLVPAAKIGIEVKKRPPIPDLTSGVAFYFGD